MEQCQCGLCQKCRSRIYSKRWYDKNRRKDPSAPHGNFGKRYYKRSKMPPELDVPDPGEMAWAAGLFEGEGSVFTERRRGERRLYVTPRMSLNTTDQDVIDRFQSVMGGNVHIQAKQHPGQKQQWKWTLYGYDPACRVLELWRPWLGIRRLSQFDKTIRECALVRGSLDA